MLVDFAQLTRRAPLLGILVVAAAVRFYHLDFQSMWNDELSTMARLSPGPGSEVFWRKVHHDVHPPGYLLFLSLWTWLFGNGESALRVPSALAGVLCVWSIYRLGRALFDEETGRFAALFAALAPFLIEYSQEARGFSLAAWLVTESACALVVLIQARLWSPWVRIVYAAVSSACAAYVHYMGLLGAASVHLLALVVSFGWARDRLQHLAYAQLGAVLLYSPWWGGFLEHLRRGGLTWLRPPHHADLLRISDMVFPGIVLLMIVVCLPFLRRGPSRPETDRYAPTRRLRALLLIGWIALIIFGSYFKSLLGTPIFSDRNLIVALPAIYACLGALFSERKGRGRDALLWGVAVGTFLLFVLGDRYYDKPTKQQFREAAAMGAAWEETAKKTHFVAVAWNKEYFSYYLRRSGSNAESLSRAVTPSSLDKKIRSAFRKGSEQVVVLVGHKHLERQHEAVLARYRVVNRKRFVGAEALLLRER